jgi:hypothetical protein
MKHSTDRLNIFVQGLVCLYRGRSTEIWATTPARMAGEWLESIETVDSHMTVQEELL